MKRLRLLSAIVVVMLPLLLKSQVYVRDYAFGSYTTTFSSIAITGTELTTLSGTTSEEVTLPFSFPFGEDTCTSITVGSDGQIAIGDVDPNDMGSFTPHTDDMSIICPLAMDYMIVPAMGSHVYYEVSGMAPSRAVTIEYNHVYLVGSGTDHMTFQVVLYESGDIAFVYDTINITSPQTAYVFMREHSHDAAISLAGQWSSPHSSFYINPITLTSTNLPERGLTLTFTRMDNSCPRPQDFHCISFARVDSVVLNWSSNTTSSLWELRYDVSGVHVDSMQNVISSLSDTFAVCSTLVAGVVYDFYLRTDCGLEQSFWEGPVRVSPGSYNMPATGTNTIYACGAMIYDDGGATGNYSNYCNSTLILMPSHPDSLVVISNGTLTTESCCDHLYVFDGVGTSGTLLYQGQGSGMTVPRIRSTSGPLTVQFTSDGSVVYGGFALQVNCERAPLCRTVTDVEVSHIAGASAFVSWSLVGLTADPSGFVVTLNNRTDSTAGPVTFETTDNYYFLSGLEEGTEYSVSVASICGTDTLRGDTLDFTTRCLVGGTTIASGTGTSQTTGVPVNSSWGNTFCQSIYTVADLNAMGLSAGPINGITYTWSSAGSYNKDIVIFMGQTTNSVFSSFSPLTGSMTQVYSGTRTTADVGTIEYYFTTPFVWDGVSNIVVSSFVNQPSGVSHSSSGFYGYSTNCGSTRTIYGYKDGTAYTMSNLTTNSSTSTSSYRPNIQFIKPCDTTATCVAPNVIVTEVLADSVSLMWAPGNGETSWNLYYMLSGDTSWTTVATNVTETSYTFTNLVPMSEYNFRVDPGCSTGDVHAIVTVTTPCVPLMTLPFTENFENFAATSTIGSPTPSCWTRGTNYSYSSYPYRSSTYAYSGNYSMYFYASGTSYYSYLALPAIGIQMDSLQVSFAARNTSSNYNIHVGVMTDPDDFSTFTQVSTILPSATSTWQMFEVPLRNYTGNGQYIAFACSGTTSYMYIDDIEVDYIPTCPRPSNLTVVNTTTSTASIHWDSDSANYFEIEYGPVGFAHGTGTVVNSMSDSVTLYGLSHSSRYEVFVCSICSAIDSSYWSFPVYFTTECGIIDTLPYIQTFAGWGSGTNARPACWTCGGYSSYPYITSEVDDMGNVLRNSLYMYTYSANLVYASLPPLDSVSYPVHLTQVVFEARTLAAYENSHRIIVGVCSAPGNLSTFVPVDTIMPTATFSQYEVSFDLVTSGGRYITFVSSSADGNTNNSVYLGTVEVDLIPPCPSPNNLTVTNNTASSAELGWNPRSTAAAWQVEYGAHGFVLGTGTRITTTNNPLVITGLSASSHYDFYVRNICGVGDTSIWSRTPGSFFTLQNPASVPYFYDFENATEWDNWQTVSNTNVNWYRDTAAGNGTPGYGNTGIYSMYVSADTGRTFSTDLNQVVNTAAYRDIDFGPNDSSFTLTFRAAAGGTPSAGYDAMMVFLVDPYIPVAPTSQNITSPWGNVLDMTPLATVRLSPYWNTYTATLDYIHGVHRLAFFWFNQSTASTPFTAGPSAVDDVRIDYIGCPRPSNVHADNITTATATIVWDGPDVADYRILCRNNLGNIVASEVVHTNSVHITDLSPGVRYSVLVRRLCSATDSSTTSVLYYFSTNFCNEGYSDTIGSTTTATTSYNLPVCNYYNYSYTQQIIPASQLSGAGTITGIHFLYNGSSTMTAKTNCTVYLGHTSSDAFASADSAISVTGLFPVYAGGLNCSNGWNYFQLNTPFAYNGTDNLVVAIDDNSGSYNSSSYTFAVEPTPASQALVYYSDSQNPNPASDNTLSNFTGTKVIQNFNNVMSFDFCPPSSCPHPVLRTPIVRSTSVTLRWRNTATEYQFSYRLASSTHWITDELRLTDTSYTIHNLLPMTDYVYRVRQICDSTGFSDWTSGQFNSSDIPCLSPTGLHVTQVTNKSVSLAWNPEENNIGYRLHVFNSYFDRTSTCYLARGTISGLTANTVYYATVQATCQNFDDPSQWSDTIQFITDVCPDATNLVANDIQGNSVVLDWTEGGRAARWEIQYGQAGFQQGDGYSIIADSHPYTVTGLVGESTYDFYVRAICDDDFFSEGWSNRVTVSTPYSSINSVTDDARVKLFPNPTSSDVLLSLPLATSPVQVEVIDISGRTQLSLTLPAGTESTQLSTSQLRQGAYFVRVTGDSINTVKKLIVR